METNHGGEANEFEDQEGADGEEDPSCFAENVIKDLRNGLRNWTRQDGSRVALKKDEYL